MNADEMGRELAAATQLDVALQRVREENGSVEASAPVARFGSAF